MSRWFPIDVLAVNPTAQEVLLGTFCVLLGALVTRWFSRHKQRVETTMRLFEAYHSEEMIARRTSAWEFLTVRYPGQPVPFHELFSEKASPFSAEDYSGLIPVIYFWLMMKTLARRREIDQRLARQLFEYQYLHWFNALEELHRQTREAAVEDPDWIPLMDEKGIDWMAVSARSRNVRVSETWRQRLTMKVIGTSGLDAAAL